MKRSNRIFIYLSLIILLSLSLISGTSKFSAGKLATSNNDSVEKRLISFRQNDNKVMDHLYHLTDRIGARPSGSENLQAACEWARNKFVEFGLSDVHLEKFMTVRADVANYTHNVPLYNVVADIPGSEKPDEYVIVGAHIDSDDAGTGAADDGTGVAAAMEAARILIKADAKPKRTIRFILFAAEEIGKLGSKAYVDAHADIMPKVSAMLNMDQGNNYISGIYTTNGLKEDFEKVFAPIKSLDPDMSFTIEKVEYLSQNMKNCCGGRGSSDHGPFFEAGVPAFFWLQEGKTPVPYPAHTKEDTYDKVNVEYLKHSATVIALGANGIANLNHLLSRENIFEKEITSNDGINPSSQSKTQTDCGSKQKSTECCGK
jgi:Zn-dependent M28 family amino/carboxypeptidase